MRTAPVGPAGLVCVESSGAGNPYSDSGAPGMEALLLGHFKWDSSTIGSFSLSLKMTLNQPTDNHDREASSYLDSSAAIP